MNLAIQPSMGKILQVLSFFRDTFGIKLTSKIDVSFEIKQAKTDQSIRNMSKFYELKICQLHFPYELYVVDKSSSYLNKNILTCILSPSLRFSQFIVGIK